MALSHNETDRGNLNDYNAQEGPVSGAIYPENDQTTIEVRACNDSTLGDVYGSVDVDAMTLNVKPQLNQKISKISPITVFGDKEENEADIEAQPLVKQRYRIQSTTPGEKAQGLSPFSSTSKSNTSKHC